MQYSINQLITNKLSTRNTPRKQFWFKRKIRSG